MDVEILSRIQFAFTVAFHYIYPPLSIGLGFLLVTFEMLCYQKFQEMYSHITRSNKGSFSAHEFPFQLT